jgi:lysophospholipase L1-like esterase
VKARALLAAFALAASAHAHAAGEPLLIEAYGDSTTLGISCIDKHCAPRADNAVTFLQSELSARFGQHVVVSNLGVGGTMAQQLLDGTDRRGSVAWTERIRRSSARIVMFNYGINEVMHSQTPEQFYAAETALVRAALASGKLPVLATSNPMLDKRLNAQLAQMAAMTRRVAAEAHVPLIDQYAYVSSLPDWQHGMSDGAHPTAALYRLKAERDFTVLEPIVDRLIDKPART